MTRGGKRENAGRKGQNKTKAINVMVTEKAHEQYKKLPPGYLNDYLESLADKNTIISEENI